MRNILIAFNIALLIVPFWMLFKMVTTTMRHRRHMRLSEEYAALTKEIATIKSWKQFDAMVYKTADFLQRAKESPFFGSYKHGIDLLMEIQRTLMNQIEKH